MADHDQVVAAADCGFCLQSSEVIDDCKVLPCNHVHCTACLAADFDIRKSLQCPLSHCRKLFNIDLESLPQHHRHSDDIPCDVCIRKHEKDPAVVYCITCYKTYCTKHMKSHDDIMEDHPNIVIGKYRKEAQKLNVRLCTIHTGLIYLKACKSCFSLMCVECLCSPGECVAGPSHEMVQLSEVVQQLEVQTTDIVDKIKRKESQLIDLRTRATKVLTEYENSTQHLLQTAKEQSMSTKYLQELRSRLKSKIITFIDKIIENLSTMNIYRMRAQARFIHSHQVDVINGHKDSLQEIHRLLNEELPRLRFEDVKFSTQDENQDELRLISYNSTFDHINGLKSSFQLPKSKKLLKTLNLPSSPLCVSYFEGDVFVGLQDGRVCKIDSMYEMQEQFLKYNNTVADVTVYKNRIYALIYGHPMEVHVSDLSGQSVTSWHHSDSVQWCNKLVIMADHVIIPDRTHQLLVVYSHCGKRLRKIQCLQLSQNWVAVCAVRGKDSVVISDYQSSVVFAVNAKTGSIQWINRYTVDPLGIAAYGQNSLVVFNSGNREFEVLDVHTGEVLLSFEERKPRKSDVLDLQITDNTMIVPDYQSKALSFYELINR